MYMYITSCNLGEIKSSKGNIHFKNYGAIHIIQNLKVYFRQVLIKLHSVVKMAQYKGILDYM